MMLPCVKGDIAMLDECLGEVFQEASCVFLPRLDRLDLG